MSETDAPAPNPLSSIISKFTDFFHNFRFPPPPPVKKDVVKVVPEVAEEKKPVIVMCPDAPVESVGAQLKVEGDDVEHVANPAVMWQVYAIGGFFLLKWAVARWKERKENKKPSDEDSPPPPTTEASE